MGTLIMSPDQIREAVLGHETGMPRHKAFRLLAQSQATDRETLLATVLESAAEPVRMRSAAAAALGHIGTANAEETLIRNLREGDAALAPSLLQALARVGGPAARDVIESVRFSNRESQAAAALAVTLISYRHRLAGHEWPQPDERTFLPRPTANAHVLRAIPADRAQVTRTLADLAEDPIATMVSPRQVTRVDCGPVSNAIFINREFEAVRTLDDLLRRKAVFGMIALARRESGTHYIGYLILTTPADGGLGIVVIRPSGTLILAGTGVTADSRVDFSLAAVERPGASATSVAGTFGAGTLTFRTLLVSEQRSQGMDPTH